MGSDGRGRPAGRVPRVADHVGSPVGRGVGNAVSSLVRGVALAVLRTESDGQLVGHPFGHLARVDEDEGGAVLEDVCGDAVQHVAEL